MSAPLHAAIAAITVLLSLLAVGSFGWGVARHFAGRQRMPPGMRLLSGASFAAWLLFAGLILTTAPPDPWAAVAGWVLFLGATLLFWRTVAATRGRPPHLAYSDAPPDVVFSHGPYAHVRHPFYLSYILFWTGTAVVLPRIGWAPVALGMAAWYVMIARGEERRFASSALSSAYRAYRARTGMLLLLPRPRFLWRPVPPDASSRNSFRGGGRWS
ncbi:methyltransferase family protein [Rhizosaccharibacter radicis]|uniref:Isoprenylcysteine carboxylmethyltransferase family protein n=1 Tax=Rhizosaccharibacter radicis TaxID=2782605 RepID=A0ABT1W3V8_9PROT|nr:hypothetical protein [Acetobacteraceae bacterium KSS12]